MRPRVRQSFQQEAARVMYGEKPWERFLITKAGLAKDFALSRKSIYIDHRV